MVLFEAVADRLEESATNLQKRKSCMRAHAWKLLESIKKADRASNEDETSTESDLPASTSPRAKDIVPLVSHLTN